jgi:probable HAF family extracellular repeat protein
MRKISVASLAVCLALAASVPLALAQGTYTQIDVPGAAQTQCGAINAAGDIAGAYVDGSGNTHGFVLRAGTYSTIDYPGSSVTYLAGINDVGQVVGGTDFISFVYDINTQTFTVISYPRATITAATSINNSGTIAGFFEHPKGGGTNYLGFELVGSTYSKVEPPTTNTSFVYGVTTSGKLVGFASSQTQAFNFAFSHGKYRKLAINEPNAMVQGVNSLGTAIVGVYQLTQTVGFLYQKGTVQTLQFGSNTTYASGVNDAGTVVGSFSDVNVVLHGFLWTPPADAAKK